eukprot:10635620-Prorocentrum_lima.AAC.1
MEGWKGLDVLPAWERGGCNGAEPSGPRRTCQGGMGAWRARIATRRPAACMAKGAVRARSHAWGCVW